MADEHQPSQDEEREEVAEEQLGDLEVSEESAEEIKGGVGKDQGVNRWA